MKKIIQTILVFLLTIISTNFIKSQNCTTLYMVDGDTGIIYAVNTTNASLTQVADYSDGQGNLAVGPDPSNTTSTVFTTSQLVNGATVFKNNISTGVTTTVGVQGFAANPTTGVVYGINNSNKTLITASPNYSNLGVITGDATFNNGVVSADSFFDNSGNLYTILVNGSAQYLYKVDLNTLIATRVVQLSGTLPAGGGRGLAFLNDRIYASVANVRTRSCGFLGLQTQQYVEFVLYEINPNTGVSIQKGTSEIRSSDCGGLLGIGGGSTEITALDLASCQAFVPTTAPTCNELFGVVSANQSIYRINLSNLGTTVVANGFPNTHGNAAYGPSPSNLSQNQFVVSQNNASSSIFRGVATSGLTTLTNTGNTIGSPIGLGTDPSTGIVYGINNKVLTRWTGSGNGTTVGTITGDANWTNGISLNDIAVDNGGNLYVITSVSDASIWLYRVNPSTLTALPVKQLTGAVPNLRTTNGNGLAYLGDFFYFSRTNGNNTDLWTLNAMTGVVTSVGSVVGANGAGNSRAFGDLASCATVTNVPASFSFNCGAPGGGIIGGTLIQNGTVQSNVLRVPISNAVNGLADFTVTGSGLSTSPSPYQVFIAQGATFVDIPVNYDGVSQSGNVTVAASVGGTPISGACAIPIVIEKDSDGDGVIDSNDLDDDNDGILDAQELRCDVPTVANSSSGTGANQDKLYFFNWTSNVFADGIQNGDSQSFTLPDGQNITATFSNVVGNTASFTPRDMNTFSGARLYQMYNTLSNTESFYSNSDGSDVSFRVTFTNTKNGNPYPLDLLALDAESTSPAGESISWSTNGQPWSLLESTGISTFTGVGSRQLQTTNTENGNSIYFSMDASTLDVSINQGGLQAVAFGIYLRCDTDNDGVPNHLDLDSDNDGCPDAIEGDENVTASQLTANRISGGVDANGVPSLVNSGGTADIGGDQGQGAGTSTNTAVNSCLDSDNDGISNDVDLDDDNDGILDSVEGFCSSQSTYTLNIAATNSAATIGANGGSFNLIYNLTSGTPVPSIGNTFNVSFTYSDFNNTVNSQNHTWSTFNTSATEFRILPNTTSLYTGLPANNSTTEASVAETPDNAFRRLLTSGSITQLGTYTTSIGALPTLSSPLSSFSSNTNLNLFSSFNLSSSGNYLNGYYAKMQVQNTVNNTNTGSTIPFSVNYGTNYIWEYTAFTSTAGSGASNGGNRGLITISQNTVTYCNHRDTDSDGTPDYLDLDSDNDGCPDATEGDENVTASQLTANRISGTVDANGVPSLVNSGGAADIGSDQGQGIGEAYNAAIQSGCFCYKPAQTTGTALDTNHGITALARAGEDNSNWPMVRKGAWTVLEAKTKGFVVNRLTDAQITAIPSADLREGMMVYNITQDCLQINIDGTATGWRCFNTQTCPDL